MGDVRNHAQHVHRSRDAAPEPFTDWFIDNVFEPHIKDMMEGNGLLLTAFLISPGVVSVAGLYGVL